MTYMDGDFALFENPRRAQHEEEGETRLARSFGQVHEILSLESQIRSLNDIKLIAVS